ncbi:MAG: hypothetical protein KAT29_14700, partial [Anaerolineales bacterium]|nr:hypothetical protein [Anaerolineales bacterium]
MKKLLPLLTLLFVLFLAACASSTQPPPEAAPTDVPPTTAPTEVEPTPTLAPIPGDPAELLGEPTGVDTFDSAANWTLFDNQCFKSEITDGKYVMTAKGLEGIVCWEVSWPQIKDFYNEITIDMPEQCQPDDRFGLLFRAPDNNRGYLYGLTCDG